MQSLVGGGIGERIVYNTDVRKIVRTKQGNLVYTSSGRYLADEIYLTAPLASLRKIKFVPPLPKKMERALGEMRMVPFTRGVIRFAGNVFGEIPPGTHVRLHGHPKIELVVRPEGRQREGLIVMANADCIAHLERRGALKEYFLSALESHFGPAVRREFLGLAMSSVPGEKASGGGWPMVKVGKVKLTGKSQRQLLMQPVGKIWIGGDLTGSEKHHGRDAANSKGAFNRGIEVARRIVKGR